MDGGEHVDPSRAFGGEAKLVQVGLVAVAGPDLGHGPIGAVEEHVFALAEPGLDDPPLPPGQYGLAFVGLDPKVRRLQPGRKPVKPDEPAALIGDHRPRRTTPLVGSQEEVARRRAGLRRRRDRHGGGSKAGLGTVVLNGARIARFDRELALAHGGRGADREGRAHGLHGRTDAGAGPNGHALPGEERASRKEAVARPC